MSSPPKNQIHLCGTWSFCAKPFEEHATKTNLFNNNNNKTLLSNLVLDIIEDVELNPNQPTVGRPGSVPNSEGVHELDAAWMRTVATTTTTTKITTTDAVRSVDVDHRENGSPPKSTTMTIDDGESGAVLALKGFNGAIRVARQVALHSPHSILTGQGAYDFGSKWLNDDDEEAEKGAQTTTTTTTSLRKRLLLLSVENSDDKVGDESTKTSSNFQQQQKQEFHPAEEHRRHQDTIGVVALRSSPSPSSSSTSIAVEIIAAVSSSGLGKKHPGRVGDSPLFASGLFVDASVGAVAATGDGDCIALFPISFVAVQEMKRLIHSHFQSRSSSSSSAVAEPEPELKNFVNLACQFAIRQFLNDSNVAAFLRKTSGTGVKNRLSDGGPLVGLCGVCYYDFDDHDAGVVAAKDHTSSSSSGDMGKTFHVQTGGGCCENWRNEYVTTHLSLFDEKEEKNQKGNEVKLATTLRNY